MRNSGVPNFVVFYVRVRRKASGKPREQNLRERQEVTTDSNSANLRRACPHGEAVMRFALCIDLVRPYQTSAQQGPGFFVDVAS